MNKKELRKELELLLARSIETVLSKKNEAATKSIRKNTLHVSKILAKKFYKSLKTKPAAKKSLPANSKTSKTPVKRSSKPAIKKTALAIKKSAPKTKSKK